MSALAELDTAPLTIEPTVNYIVNDGAEMFTYTGGPGSTEVKSGGNARSPQGRHAQRPASPRTNSSSTCDGFRFVHHDTKCRTSSTRPRSGASITRRWRR